MADQSSRVRVLHVDDDPAFVDTTTAALERVADGFAVEGVTSAREALAHLETEPVDCVVSDYEMPEMDGLELLTTVRERYPDLPFVLFTGKGSEEIASDAVSAGASDYLQKGGGLEQYELLANRVETAVDQYRAERAAEQTDRRMRELAENAADVLWMYSSDWEELLFLDSNFEELWGQSLADRREEPTTLLEAVHPEDRERVRATMDRLSAGEAATVEFRVNEAEDYRRWVMAEGQPIYEDGEVARIAGYTRDITERKERELELERYERIFEGLNDGVYVIDADERLIYVNDRYAELKGTDRETLLGTDLAALTSEASMREVRAARQRVAEGDRDVATVETTFHTVDGDTIPAEVRVTNLTRPDGELERVGVVRDISDRKERERALERLHDATRELMDATTVDEVAETASETAMAVLDLSMNGVHLSERGEDGLVPVAWSNETDAVLDGRPPTLPVDDSLAGRAFRAGETRAYADVRESDAVFDPDTAVRSELYVPIGDYGVLVGSSTTPDDFDDSDETLARVLAANVEAALDRVEREQERQRQNERLEEFVSVVSHDLRNPLEVAQTRAELLEADCESEHLDHLRAAQDRMTTLIEDLLTLARQGDAATDTEPVRVDTAVRECWRTVETGDADLVVETERTVLADRSRLQQLLANLARNSVEHGSTSSRTQPDDSVEHGGPGVTVTVGDLPEGFYVADDGVGIPAAERDRVFDSGYSTDEDGTGFGLAIVAEIARAHGWTVDVTESEGGGARFEVTGVETPDE